LNADTKREIPKEVAREIARLGEIRLSASLTLALAADSRAVIVAGFLGVIATTVAVATLAYWIFAHLGGGLIYAGAVVATLLFVAMALALLSARATDFWVAGGDPDSLRSWAWDGEGWRSDTDLLDGSGARYQESISKNGDVLKNNGRLFNMALYIAVAALPAGLMAFLLA
jgi:hypothetical protein